MSAISIMTKSKPPKEAPGYKTLEWEGDSKGVFCDFPDAVQQDAGFQLSKVQRGDPADNFKPMGTVGAGVVELIVNDEDGWFRIFYVAKFPPAVYVLHAFQKKTNTTAAGDIEKGRKRYSELVARLRADKIIK